MNFSSFFAFQNNSPQLPIGPVAQPAPLPITPDSSLSPPPKTGPIGTHGDLSAPIVTGFNFPGGTSAPEFNGRGRVRVGSWFRQLRLSLL